MRALCPVTREGHRHSFAIAVGNESAHEGSFCRLHAPSRRAWPNRIALRCPPSRPAWKGRVARPNAHGWRVEAGRGGYAEGNRSVPNKRLTRNSRLYLEVLRHAKRGMWLRCESDARKSTPDCSSGCWAWLRYSQTGSPPLVSSW